MKAANDVVDYLTNKENKVEEWQIAAINAMYDTCKTMEPGQTVIPYDLPYAIKGLLLQPIKRFLAISGGFDTNIAQVVEQVEQVLMLERMVLDDQNAIGH